MKKSLDTYFYSENIKNNLIRFTPDEINHIINVWRVENGDEIFVTDGKGKLFTAIVKVFKRNELVAEIIKEEDVDNSPGCAITLCIGLTSSGRLESAVDICTQLGVEKLCFFQADRVNEKWSDKRIDTLLNRSRRIAISAIKQCKTTILPDIQFIGGLDYILRIFKDYDHLFYADFDGIPGFYGMDINPRGSYMLIVGPPGDFSSRERELMDELKIIPVTLGNRRLRTESASIVIVSKLLTTLKYI